MTGRLELLELPSRFDGTGRAMATANMAGPACGAVVMMTLRYRGAVQAALDSKSKTEAARALRFIEAYPQWAEITIAEYQAAKEGIPMPPHLARTRDAILAGNPDIKWEDGPRFS